jgi:YD repeat-containing protein
MTSTGALSGVGSFTTGYRYKLSVCVTGGNTTGIPSGENISEVFVLSSNPIYPIGNVYYDKIIERRIDNSENDLGYTKYTYLNRGDLMFSSFLTKNFQNLVFSGDGWGAPLYNIYDYSWYRNKLIKKEDFARVQGQYKPVSTEEYFYLPKYTDTLKALSTSYSLKGYGASGSGIVCPTTSQFISSYERINYSPYEIYSGYLSLDSASVVKMFDSGNISRNTRYEYSLATLLPSKIEELNSGQLQKNIKMFKYAGDFSGINSDAHGVYGLLQKNIIGANVEQSEYVMEMGSSNKKLISASFSSYHQNQPTIASISKIEVKTPLVDFTQAGLNGSSLIRDIRYSPYVYFDQYDEKYNLSEQHMESASRTCYIWSYNRLYPIAEIKNADYATIESILGGSVAVSSFAASNPTDVVVNTLINTLRNSALLKDAQITSYTYKPLVGMTSSTDAKGMTTYYEYDAFQRLKAVKDQNGNILKQTDYHYKN